MYWDVRVAGGGVGGQERERQSKGGACVLSVLSSATLSLSSLPLRCSGSRLYLSPVESLGASTNATTQPH